MLQATGVDPRVGVMIMHHRRDGARGGASQVLAERRGVPAAVETRLSALDRPQRTSTAREYVG